MSIHTIFVPTGMSVEQVWAYIQNGVPVPTTNTAGRWVNVDEKGKVVA